MMRRFFLVQAVILLCHSFAPAYSLPENTKLFAKRSVNEILRGNYADALHLADSAALADKVEPLAPIIRLIAIGARDIDLDTLLDSSGFFQSYQSAINRIARYEKQHGTSSYTKMLLGFCKGLHASYYLRLESYIAAMQTGFDALSLLDDAYTLDTTNTDALLFLGLYDYARGELKKKLWWVLFWYSGSKERGIMRLQKCGETGMLASTASFLALADIYVREKKPSECLSIIKRLEKDSTQGRFVLWATAKYFESSRNYHEAALSFELLSLSYSAEPGGSYNSLVTKNRQAHMLYCAGRKNEASAVCVNILHRAQGKRNKLIYRDTEKLSRQINGSENR